MSSRCSTSMMAVSHSDPAPLETSVMSMFAMPRFMTERSPVAPVNGGISIATLPGVTWPRSCTKDARTRASLRFARGLRRFLAFRLDFVRRCPALRLTPIRVRTSLVARPLAGTTSPDTT